jgi:hypothetical protein
MGRPKNNEKKVTIEIQASPKMIAYLDQIRKMEEFGETRQEIVKRFVWDGIRNLLPERRLKPK